MSWFNNNCGMVLLGNNMWLGYNDCFMSWLFNNHSSMWSDDWFNYDNGWSEDWLYNNNWMRIYNNDWLRFNYYNRSWLFYNDDVIVMRLLNYDYVGMRLFYYNYVLSWLLNNYYILLLLEYWLLGDYYFLNNINVILGFNKKFSHKFLVMEDRNPF